MSIPTILCVDDEQIVLFSLKRQLSRLFPDYAIETVESSQVALARVDELALQGIEVPLLIVDQGLLGEALVTELQARYPQIVKVMLVGQATIESVVNVVNRGNLYRLIVKPWSDADLQNVVMDSLQHYWQERQRIQQQVGLQQTVRDLEKVNATLERQVQARNQQLHYSEQRLHHFIEHTPVAVAIFDRQMCYLAASHKWLEDYQLGDECIIGKCHYDIFPNIPPYWREVHQRGLKGIVGRNEQDPYMRPDGQQDWVRWEVRPWYETETSIGGIIIFGEVITDRVLTEIALQESEERYRLLSEVSPVGIYRNNFEGSCTYANEKALEITGLSSEEILAGQWEKSIYPDDRAFVSSTWHSFIQQNRHGNLTELRLELRFLHRDGSIVWGLAQAVPECNAQGQVVGFIGSVTDISDRKQAEALLRDSEQRYATLAEASPVGIFRNNAKGEIVYGNDRWYEIMGLARDQGWGLNWLQAIHPDWREQLFQSWQSITQEQSHRYIESCLRMSDGQIKWVYCQVQPEKDATGDVIGYVGTLTDITELKHVEAALRLSEERLQLALEGSGDGLWDWNLITDEMYFSPRWWEMLGYEVDELPGNVQTWHQLMHPADRPWVVEILQAHLQDDSRLYAFDYRMLCKSGEWKWITSYGKVVVRDENSKPLRMTGTHRDISDRKRAEEAAKFRQQQVISLLNNIPHAAWLKDQEGRFLSVNAPFGEACGYDPSQLVGLTDLDIWPRELAASYQQDDRDVMLSGHQKRVEEYFVASDGTGKWVETIKTPVFDDWGEPIGMAGISMDITKRKRSEQILQQLNQELEQRVQQRTHELQQQTQLLQIILNSIGDGVLVANTSGEIILHNPAAENIPGLGVSINSDALQNFWGIYLPGGIPCATDQLPLMRAMQGESIDQAEMVLRNIFHPEGIYIEVTARPLYDNHQSLIGGVAVLRNVTDRKQAEQALQAERLRLQLALEAADMGTWEANFETGIWSEKTEAIFGYAPGTFPGDRESFLKLVYREDQERVFQSFAHSLTTGEPYNIEYRINRQDGELRWVAVRGKVIQPEDDESSRIIGIAVDITERKQTEEAIRLSQEQLQLALEGSGDGLWDWDIATDNAYLSPRLLGMLGYEADELPGHVQTWVQMIHPDDKEQAMLHLHAHLQDQIPYQVEYRARSKTGEWRWIAVYGKVVNRDFLGKPLRMVGLQRDITDRKQAEIALQESQRFLQTVIDTFPLVVWWKDCHLVYLGCNQKAAEAAGLLAPAEIIGKTDYDLPWGATHAEEYRADDREVLNSGIAKLGIIETQLRSDGSIIWIETNKLPLYNLSGEIVGLLGTYQDITDRKQAEEALRDSEERLRLALMAAKQGLYDLNLQTGQVIVSPEYAIMLGYDPDEFQETSTTWLERLHPDDSERGESLYQAYIKGTLLEHVWEFRQRTKTGEWKWILSLGKLVSYDADGNPLRMLGTHMDIDDRKVNEAALLQAKLELEDRVEQRTAELRLSKEAAEAANRAKSIFLANMSHELRTPLNAILGFSQLLSRSNALDVEQQRQINIINRSGEHLLNLINDILEMSKIEAGRMILTPKNFDLYQLLKSIDEMFYLRAQSKGLQIMVDYSNTLPKYVYADENKLRQVLINLMNNAIKFTNKGYIRLKIQVVPPNSTIDNYLTSLGTSHQSINQSINPLGQDQVFLRFAVEDTGPGIAPIEQAALFEPFVQAQAGQASLEGTGLGLPISRQFVRLLGGELSCHSTLGQGSTFRFEIPVKTVQAINFVPQRSRHRVIGLQVNQPTYRLLIVEDNCENRQFLVQLLRPIGFEVQEAENGQEAIAVWQQWRPHLVWMDIRMPTVDGYEATRQIRALEAQEKNSPSILKTKILALTASAFEDERAAILASGCDDLVCKPITEEILFDKMAEHLEIRYIYEAGSLSTASSPEIANEIVFVDNVQNLSLDWITQLQRAARMADEELILQLLDELALTQASLANQLRSLVYALRLDKLIEFTIEASNDLENPNL
ncbi:PAS domain S-box protein [Alkalinema pantanalense CENA528]|uniref:PAS domain S-box protein n=1 Tax=Alkalinema pantanalense TaxID=1620705 RepID=UPI003D6ECD34